MRGYVAAALLFAGLGTPARPPGDADIFVRDAGQGRRCWVLIHPFGASGRFWERRAPELARAHGVTIFSPDLPSHGRSRIVGRFDYRAATRAVRAALRQSCPRPALIVGASSGGIVAMQLGATTGSRVVAIGVGWAFSEANIGSLRANAAASPGAFLTAYADQGERQTAAITRHFGDLAELGTAPLLSADEARGLRGRLLIVQGDRDDFFRPEAVARLQAAVPGSRVLWFAGADHLGPLAPPNAARLWEEVSAFARAH